MQTLTPTSDRSSTLRGIASASVGSSGSGAGENNLAFKCTRKRFVIETFHLDVEGGIGERRTTAPTGLHYSEGSVGDTIMTSEAEMDKEVGTGGGAAVRVQIASDGSPASYSEQNTQESQGISPKPKSKRKVGFQTDRPDVYDF